MDKMDNKIYYPKEITSERWKITEYFHLRRYVLAMLAFLGFCNVYTLRVNLSVAVVAMTRNYSVVLPNGTVYYTQDFPWDMKERGYILSAFFYGYVTTQFLGGWLGMKIGGAKVFGFGIASTATLTLLTPFVASMGIYAIIALRVLEGVCEGVSYPCMHTVWAKWAPPKEITTLVSFATAGAHFGILIAMPGCGLLAEAWGWESVFFVPGATGVLWAVVWFVYVRDSPEDDPRISQKELIYLKESIPDVPEQVILPWKGILTSMPVWAFSVAQLCECWGGYTLVTQLPTFINGRFNLNVDRAGYLSALPYLATSFILPAAGLFGDMLIKREIFTITKVRKIFIAFGFITEAVFMMLSSYTDSATMTIMCLILAAGLGVFSHAAFNVNQLDVAPQYAGILMGISNAFSTVSGMFAPAVAGIIITDKHDIIQWRTVFFISSSLYLFGAAFYTIFGSGKRQYWAAIEEKKDVELKILNNEKQLLP